ncbi:hypothetical protein [Nesterenkonia rhizosphaerae]|uniref:Uncharacterized protein n=1 Tax=Nesterenkonia rhizosphaerae TaxID=1348272 RepID=A0ABP9FU69_9MICC
MIGNRDIVEHLVKLLRRELEPTARLLEQMKGIPVGSVVVPNSRDIHPTWVDVIALNRYPSIMVTLENTDVRATTRQTEVSAEYDEFSWAYRLRITQHVMGTDYGLTEEARRNLLDTLRLLLMRNRTIWRDKERAEQAIFHPLTMREEFMGADEGGKILLESHTLIDVHSQERVPAAQPSRGPGTVAIHPALIGEP